MTAAYAIERYHILESAVREHELCAVFKLLRGVGVEPTLLKGWSVGRLYPDPGMRHLGDIDLLVCDEERSTAETALREQGLDVDWHTFSELRREFVEPKHVVRRSELVHLGDTQIRVLCHEDNLHFVAIHMLRHAAWLPRWVSDIDVLLRSRPANFDWKVCLGHDPIRAGWVLSALVLAHELAGMEISGTPAENYRIPDWVVPAVLKGREDPHPGHVHPTESIWSALAHPWRLPHGLRKRWPNPITAAIITGARFEDWSPSAHQLRYCTHLIANFLSRTF